MTSLFLTNFHFIRPWWFLALIGLFLALWLLKKHRFHQSPWSSVLPAHLSQVLVEGGTTAKPKESNRLFSFFSFGQGRLLNAFCIGLLTITALAGPAWQKLPQPVYQTERGSVLIMDMSYSMYATDIKPNRLTRARYKAIDLLNKINEGDVGLIAYAGDAFVISPLTQDIKNIELLLPSLSPDIMPEVGANPYAALILAHDMLSNAGHLNGDIYWFTDDVDNEDIKDIYDWSAKYGHQLNILGVGSANGAPITLPSGELLKDDHGAIVVPKLPAGKLQALAQKGHGSYNTITYNDSDIDTLIANHSVLEQNKKNSQQDLQQGDQWQEEGPWLLVFILPLLLGYFRRGSAILCLPFACLPLLFLLSLSVLSTNSFAAENDITDNTHATSAAATATTVNDSNSLWQNLWQTQDQQAQQHFNQQDYQGAAAQFENSQWQASAHYKAGNYQQALQAYQQGKQANTANSLYNQGNALAQLQKYEEAIATYEQALAKDENLQDAKDNIEKIKQFLKQQEQEQQQNQDQNQDKDQGEQSEQQQDQQQNSQQEQQQSSEQNADENADANSDANNQQNQDSENQQSEQAQKNTQQGQNQQEKDAQSQAEQQAQQEKQAEQAEQEKLKQAEQQSAESQQAGEEKTAAQIAAEQQAKETEQKHQQLLNKVTDDPYLLLRNKMQLEYQKRRQGGASQGAKKKW